MRLDHRKSYLIKENTKTNYIYTGVGINWISYIYLIYKKVIVFFNWIL